MDAEPASPDKDAIAPEAWAWMKWPAWKGPAHRKALDAFIAGYRAGLKAAKANAWASLPQSACNSRRWRGDAVTGKGTGTGRGKATVIDAHVGSRLRAMRLERHLSQTATAMAVGLTFQQIQKYERGSNRVSASTLYSLAKVFGVQVGPSMRACSTPS